MNAISQLLVHDDTCCQRQIEYSCKSQLRGGFVTIQAAPCLCEPYDRAQVRQVRASDGVHLDLRRARRERRKRARRGCARHQVDRFDDPGRKPGVGQGALDKLNTAEALRKARACAALIEQGAASCPKE